MIKTIDGAAFSRMMLSAAAEIDLNTVLLVLKLYGFLPNIRLPAYNLLSGLPSADEMSCSLMSAPRILHKAF